MEHHKYPHNTLLPKKYIVAIIFNFRFFLIIAKKRYTQVHKQDTGIKIHKPSGLLKHTKMHKCTSAKPPRCLYIDTTLTTPDSTSGGEQCMTWLHHRSGEQM
jgi:hypothetical protein